MIEVAYKRYILSSTYAGTTASENEFLVMTYTRPLKLSRAMYMMKQDGGMLVVNHQGQPVFVPNHMIISLTEVEE